MSTEGGVRAWVEVRGAALRRNARRIQEAVGPDVALIPVVKADAYGLGADRAVAVLEDLDPGGYAVATVQEGGDLRARGVTRPVFVLAPVPAGAMERAVREGLTLSLSDSEGVEALRAAAFRAGRTASYHLEIDTGMGRAGLDWRRVDRWKREVDPGGDGGVRWAGCFTHFHSADDPDSASMTLQWERFQDALRSLAPLPTGDFRIHACNSPAALRIPGYGADAVRPGIFLYGGRPGQGLPLPEPVVALRARITLIRDRPPGSTVGYGATYRARGWERWATISAGYGDGIPRALSNRGEVLVRGRRAPVVGRISMDMTVVDITHVPGAAVGDVATFIGMDEGSAITLEEVAEWADTINYEVLTGLSARLPRIWIEEGTG